MTRVDKKLDELCVNAIRMLAVDAVEKAKSGHPGMPLGAAPMAYVLWSRFLKHNPKNPKWPDRDRFILSAGHGCALLYSLLHLTGYGVTLADMKSFRQFGSITPGHPEYRVTPSVEATTGPLGQGFSMGVGMALAERFMAARYNKPDNKIIDHYTYAIVSDGDLMEGVASEAASFAGNQRLGKLIYLYDDNHISIEGGTEIAFTEDRCARFEAYGWHVQSVADGNDLDTIDAAIRVARDERKRPSLIAVRTHIGFGSPKHDSASAHGEPLGREAMKATREFFGWDNEPFHIPDEAREHLLSSVEKGKAHEAEWQKLFNSYEISYPDEAHRLIAEIKGELPTGWDIELPEFEPGKDIATRSASGKIINSIARSLPNLIGGSADLAPSTKTELEGAGSASNENPIGRNIHFGVREHAMGAAVNGMALHGGAIPYGSTFLTFSDYMRPAIRLAALMDIHSIFVFTHDSVGLGEDGPTHQPIEQLAALRAIPNLTVIRPADANETAEAWRYAIEARGPIALALSRQNLPVIDRKRYAPAAGLKMGAYTVSDSKDAPALIIIATGSELHLALAAKEVLGVEGVGVRVVSMPSWEIFERQPKTYRDSVLAPDVGARVAIEAGSSMGWHRWVGPRGIIIGIDRFGTSAPGEVAMEKLGMTTDRIVQAAKELLEI